MSELPPDTPDLPAAYRPRDDRLNDFPEPWAGVAWQPERPHRSAGFVTLILAGLAVAIVLHACVDTAAQAANIERPIVGAAIG